jgi:hypothetical protein
MDATFRKFYRNFYLRTGGLMPSGPVNQTIFPGDFFQIINGEMMILGNIFRKGIIDPVACQLEPGVKLNPAQWTFNDGLTKPYSGRGTGTGIDGSFEFSKEIISFRESGSFYFKGNHPESVRIANWNDIAQQLIIKMTATVYSFRELYVVTESASLSDWTLAISGAENAEMELATDDESAGVIDIFGHHKSKVIQSKDLFFYHRESKRKPAFFRAKKLVVQQEKMNTLVSGLNNPIEKKWDALNAFYDPDLTSAPFTNSQQPLTLDMLPLNALNANTALAYFEWDNINLDDLEKYFPIYSK